MRVLVTGATGYIGSAVAEVLSGAGHTVVGLARSREAEAELARRGHETVSGDLRHPRTLAAAAASSDGVVHTAVTQDADMGPCEQASVRVFLEALSGSNRPFIYTSGVWVYGSAPPGGMLVEESPTDPVAIFDWRPALEQEVLSAASAGVRSIVIRPAMVYGRGGGPLNQFGEMAHDGAPRYVGDGANHWALVHVDDLAELYLLALDSAPPGTLVNAARGEPVPVRELAAAATAGGRFRSPPAPWPLTEAAATLGPAVAEALTRNHRMSGQRAERLLGWRPPPRAPLEELRAMQPRSR